MVVQTGTTTKVLDKDVTLPNGSRVEYRTQSMVLANGTRVHLKEGDLLSLNGELIQKSPSNVAPPADATASLVPIASSAPAAPKPAAPAPRAVAATPPAASVATAPAAAAFSYRSEAPVNGKLRGVVELGASGFNMFIIRVDDKRNWKLEKAEFGNSLVMENMATEEDVRTGLKSYIGKMLDFGVPGRDIHFVVSSGAAMAENTRRIVKGLEALKYVVTTVTPEREGTLGLRAALPAAYATKGFVVDMGSANSKISWYANGQPRVEDTYGSKYYEKNVDDATVAAAVKAKAAQVPANLRGTCYIIGGVPYELAKAVRQGQEAFTVLKAPSDYTQLSGAKMKSGLNIYQALAQATGCQQFVFGYDTNFTIGYLLSL
ncbi:hypothetical protein GCM10022409_44100 [Hymenobacter glaciei]|uniref:DUF6799 domain-containing protein n=2 Tax=Hymenobacter glaciei TaxID=877209 RepID=A0ABP7UTG0_9BACT